MRYRAIRFRGLTKDGKWKYGFLGFNAIEGSFYIHEVEDIPPTQADPCGSVYSERFTIEPETIGQFTGLHAQHDPTKPIYEGDILKSNEHIDIVIWREDLCGFSFKNDKSRMNLVDWLENAQYSHTEIIGNIHELNKP